LSSSVQILIAYFRWSELTIWPKGVNVKHVKGLFKAEGINNTAEPGNSMHYMYSTPGLGSITYECN